MQLRSFTEFLKEEAPKEIVFTFGRFNPPTLGHEKLFDKVAEVARGKPYRIYVSHSQDSKRNPLSPDDKVQFMRKGYQRHARAILADNVNNVLQVCSKLYGQGFTKVTLVCGSDRVLEFEALLTKYNGEKMQDGFYNFDGGVKVVSAGSRDSDADDVTGVSSSKLREAAATNDLEAFSRGLTTPLRSFGRDKLMFNAVRRGMGLKESRTFRTHIQLESVGARREAYVAGNLFAMGDQVVVKDSEEIGKIDYRGSNYVIVLLSEGRKVRKWLEAVDPIHPDDTADINVLIPLAIPTLVESARPPIMNPTIEGTPISAIRRKKLSK